MRALVGALQWGLLLGAVPGLLAGLLGSYYRLGTAWWRVLLPPWELAVPVAFLVGALGGWWWVTSGRAAESWAAHRARVRFVVATVGLWLLHRPLETAVTGAVAGRIDTLPYVLLPTLFSLAVLVGAYLLAYQVDPAVYARLRARAERLVEREPRSE